MYAESSAEAFAVELEASANALAVDALAVEVEAPPAEAVPHRVLAIACKVESQG